MQHALPFRHPLPSLFASTEHRDEFHELLDAGALVAVSSSGGKDSQAMTILLSRIVPAEQLLLIHAPLGVEEWPGTQAHIERTLPEGVPLRLAHTASGKSLLARVAERGMWPDPMRRWCTGDLKRTPIERELRRHLKEHPRYGGRIISAMGLRADESPRRRTRAPWVHNARNSKAGRRWFDWLPIHAFSTDEVFTVIADAGQQAHWAYHAGVSRVSCSFCIMGSRHDLSVAAHLRPELYARYVRLERRIGHTLSPSRRPLPAITGIAA